MNLSLPLAGLHVLVTFDDPERTLGRRLESRGAHVTLAPLVQIEPIEPAIKDLAERIEQAGTLVFFSKSAVRTFAQFADVDSIARPQQVVAMGIGSRRSLESLGIENVVIPQKSNSKGLAECLVFGEFQTPIVLVRAETGSQWVPDSLKAAKIDFEQVSIYRNVPIQLESGIRRRADEGDFDWVTIASPSLAEYAHEQLGDAVSQMKIVSISPSTTERIESLGLSVAAEAEKFNYEGMAAAVCEFQSSRS